MLYSTGKREAQITKENSQTDLEKESRRLEDGRRIIFYTFDDETPRQTPDVKESQPEGKREDKQ